MLIEMSDHFLTQLEIHTHVIHNNRQQTSKYYMRIHVLHIL